MDMLEGNRKSHVEHGALYFWTATINGWKHLMSEDTMKMEVIQSLQWLVHRKLITVYAFVIMPNHLHLIWRVNANNGRESPQGSLLKFTAHQFRKILYNTNQEALKAYEVVANNKSHEFWQRDSLAVLLYNRPFLLQKITYIHNNPVAKHWQLSESPEAYRFSSASFYETGIDEFGILTHIGDAY
ncbi:MAG: transposase [Bacteroidota bacterium]